MGDCHVLKFRIWDIYKFWSCKKFLAYLPRILASARQVSARYSTCSSVICFVHLYNTRWTSEIYFTAQWSKLANWMLRPETQIGGIFWAVMRWKSSPDDPLNLFDHSFVLLFCACKLVKSLLHYAVMSCVSGQWRHQTGPLPSMYRVFRKPSGKR